MMTKSRKLVSSTEGQVVLATQMVIAQMENPLTPAREDIKGVAETLLIIKCTNKQYTQPTLFCLIVFY